MTDIPVKPPIPPGPNRGATKPAVAFIATFIGSAYVIPWLKLNVPQITWDDTAIGIVQGTVLSFILLLTPHNILTWIAQLSRSLRDALQGKPPPPPDAPV